MNLAIIIMTAVLVITLSSPIGVYLGVNAAKKKDFKSHRKIQNVIFIICVLGVLVLEGLIKSVGGSGSLASQSDYYGTNFFKYTLFSHIIVAILSYLIWAILIVVSNIAYTKSLPGKLSNFHKIVGFVIFIGLVYTAITALLVYLMTLNLI